MYVTLANPPACHLGGDVVWSRAGHASGISHGDATAFHVTQARETGGLSRPKYALPRCSPCMHAPGSSALAFKASSEAAARTFGRPRSGRRPPWKVFTTIPSSCRQHNACSVCACRYADSGMRTRVLLLAAAACGVSHALHIESAGLRPLQLAKASPTATASPNLKAKAVAASQSDALRLKGGAGEQV